MHRSYPFLSRIFLILGMTIAGLACAIPGLGNEPPSPKAGGPVVTISSPTSGQVLEPAGEIKIQSTSLDPEGVTRVELVVDGEVIWIDANAQPETNTPFIVAQLWTPTVPGTHVIQVRAYNAANVAGQSDPVTVNVVAEAQAVAEGAPVTTPEPNPPTATPISALASVPTPTSTPLPATAPSASTPTPTVVLSTPTPTPTPGTFAATGLEPEGRFEDIWLEVGAGDSPLGYPTGPVITNRDFARQFFEKGLMFWWDSPDDPNLIWVIDSPAADLNSGATSNRYPDTWDDDDDFSCEAARENGDKGPVRGFGKLWCERPELQTRLGDPGDNERGSGGSPPFAEAQFFQGGVMIYNPIDREVYVLFDQGNWWRFANR
jgi:hypothetical protein